MLNIKRPSTIHRTSPHQFEKNKSPSTKQWKVFDPVAPSMQKEREEQKTCKDRGPCLNSSNTKHHQTISVCTTTTPHFEHSPLHLCQGKWLNIETWCGTRTSPNIRQWIRVKRTYRRRCGCEVPLDGSAPVRFFFL